MMADAMVDAQPDSNDEDALARPAGPVLVIGGAGYIGSHTVRLLEERGVESFVLDNLSTGHRDALGAGSFVECDLGDVDALRAVLRERAPRAVVHFAAKCYVGESMDHPARYYRENVLHTFGLLEAMREVGCRDIVFSSTCATYGAVQRLPLDEDHPQHPISTYGKTKLHIEHMLTDFARAYGLRFAALRYFNAAGAAPDGTLGEDHDPETHLIPLALQVALGQREELLIFGDDYDTPDGTCVRDYVHVSDLADAHLRALSRLQQGEQQIFCNLGTGTGYSVAQVIDAARRITGHPIPVRVVGRRAGDPPALYADGTRARSLLGWRARRGDLDQIVRDAWNFHRKRPAGFGGG